MAGRGLLIPAIDCMRNLHSKLSLVSQKSSLKNYYQSKHFTQSFGASSCNRRQRKIWRANPSQQNHQRVSGREPDWIDAIINSITMTLLAESVLITGATRSLRPARISARHRYEAVSRALRVPLFARETDAPSRSPRSFPDTHNGWNREFNCL